MFTDEDIRRALGAGVQRFGAGGAVTFRRAVTDSRRAQPGDLFVALPGERVDGHAFVGEAFARGAAGVLVSRPGGAVPAGRVSFQVADTLIAMQALARWVWQERQPALPALSITGTVGKTSTKEVAARVFGRRYAVLMSEGGLNGDIGLPQVLLNRESSHTFAVLELGMHSKGEISLQCRLAPPLYGIVTNIGYTHMERLGSRAAIVEAKRELVEHLPPHGAAALNGDDPLVMSMRPAAKCRVLVYGQGDQCDVRATGLESLGRDGLRFTLGHAGRTVAVRTPLPGPHNVYTCLSTAAAALADGFTLDDVAGALARVENPLRLKFGEGPHGSLLIDDTYNASPASMAAALRVLAEQQGRRLAVLGDMLELGEVEEGCHRDLGRDAASVADVLFTVGPRARWIAEAARAAGARDVREFPAKAGLAEALLAEVRAGDVLLLKGSRGLALETVVVELTSTAGAVV